MPVDRPDLPAALTPARAALAPAGTLRAAINLGNPLLAHADPASGAPRGVSVDLAQALADRLGVPLECLVFHKAADSVAAVTQEQADIGFFAADPARADGLRFTEPYLLIEGGYLVHEASPLQTLEEVDRAGISVVVGQGSAYDLFLSRELRAATLLRAPSTPEVVPTFLAQGAAVAAGLKPQLQADATRLGGLRLLPGAFMTIRQSMGLPASRGAAAAEALEAFLAEAKASGWVAQALARHGVSGVSVAP